MTTYTARAHREGKWWVLDVEGVGTTQARTINDCQAQAADLIEAMTGEQVPAYDVALHVALPPKWERKVQAARRASQRAQQAQHDAAAKTRTVVRELAEQEHLSQNDLAAILGVSRQRIGQLVK